MKQEELTYNDLNEDNSNVNNETDEMDITEERRIVLSMLTLKKGKCPESDKGVTHKLMALAWEKGKIENIYESTDNDCIYQFFFKCVSRAVGKRRWNECSQVMRLSEFVTPSDEAFAMLVLENNLPKWMDEFRFSDSMTKKERRNTLYTEGSQGRKWNVQGMMRYVELLKFCEEYRHGANEQKKERYRQIEEVVKTREEIWNENSNRKRRKVVIDNNDVENESDNNEEDEMERYLLAMANGDNVEV